MSAAEIHCVRAGNSGATRSCSQARTRRTRCSGLLFGYCPCCAINIIVNRERCTQAVHRNLHLASRIRQARSYLELKWSRKRRLASVLLRDACRRVAPGVPCRHSKDLRLSVQRRSYPPTDGAILSTAFRANGLSVQVRRLRPGSSLRSRSSPSKGRAPRESVPIPTEAAPGDPRPTAATDWPRREAWRQFVG